MNVLVTQSENLVKAKLVRALAGGFAGTLVFTLMGLFLAPNIIGQPMDVAALIAPMLGGSHTAGVIAHFVTGAIIFPIAYLILGIRTLPGPGLSRWQWSCQFSGRASSSATRQRPWWPLWAMSCSVWLWVLLSANLTANNANWIKIVLRTYCSALASFDMKDIRT